MDGINLKTTHRNEVLAINAAQSASTKLSTAEKTLAEAKVVLQRLQTQNPEYTTDYFSNQWERQKKCQLDAMSNGTLKNLEEQLINLLDLEEKLRDALSQLNNLRKKKRRNRTEAEKEAAITLPASIVAMESAIGDVVKQLGSEDFRKLKQATDPKARALIRVRLAKMKLYEAKVGIIVAQKQWDKNGQGTKIQQNLKKLMTRKQLMFKRKWESYRLQVTKYNAIRPLSHLTCPKIDESKALPFEDIFWNVEPLSHPSERWAVDPGTIEGIQSYLKYRSSCEELRRIGREVRQMVLASLQTDNKLDSLHNSLDSDWDRDNGGKELIELIQPGQRVSKDVWEASVEVMRTVYRNLRQSYCRKWMDWDSDMGRLLRATLQYTTCSEDDNLVLFARWQALVRRGKMLWEVIVDATSVEASGLDELEIIEQNLMLADEEDDVDDLMRLNELYLMDDTDDSDDEMDIDDYMS
ncbi:uncharacterized protein MELLADRAFT_96060 [Melampsora larici-populina 98AG31]|uniref:Uncharacterized protein n=1 Tax=Melampsora larici-populina (strain 98AG31 / pathotype 3-4-7) TaxID=747676 RepID=F4SAT7_MELLP|nr:uncharacterized protein MELLADRAFT_96060 [Melampsora larici-populina 98AG31]EGF98247.1 hypothetical protein MELLADRAFT_96060 [Melampsora larici-populina 98AG31]